MLQSWIASIRRRGMPAAAGLLTVVVVIVSVFWLWLLLQEFWESIQDIIYCICVIICCSRFCRSCSRRCMLLTMAEKWSVITDWSNVGVTVYCTGGGVVIVPTGAV